MAKKQAAHPRRKAASSSSELDNECAAILKLASQEEDQHFQIAAEGRPRRDVWESRSLGPAA